MFEDEGVPFLDAKPAKAFAKPVVLGVACVAVASLLAACALLFNGCGSFCISTAEQAGEPSNLSLETSNQTDASSAAGGDAAGSASDGASGDAAAGNASADGSQAQDGSTTIFVHVVGAVATPGLYELPAGSRLASAVQAAGGFTKKASQESVNLARTLEDGEQVNVPTKAEAKAAQQGNSTAASTASAASGSGTAASAASSQGSSSGAGLVNINTASSEELQTLSGIGEKTAQKIIEDREANGAFESVDDLTRVSGIGDKKLEAIRNSITVG